MKHKLIQVGAVAALAAAAFAQSATAAHKSPGRTEILRFDRGYLSPYAVGSPSPRACFNDCTGPRGFQVIIVTT
jgi:hypothetical protein